VADDGKLWAEITLLQREVDAISDAAVEQANREREEGERDLPRIRAEIDALPRTIDWYVGLKASGTAARIEDLLSSLSAIETRLEELRAAGGSDPELERQATEIPHEVEGLRAPFYAGFADVPEDELGFRLFVAENDPGLGGELRRAEAQASQFLGAERAEKIQRIQELKERLSRPDTTPPGPDEPLPA
jgi:hypothetical protein